MMQQMKKYLLFSFAAIALGGYIFFLAKPTNQSTPYGAPPYIEEDQPLSSPHAETSIWDFSKWKRPEGPLKVGIQAGHWKNSELPDELDRIRNNGGTSNKQIAEWEVNLRIAEETKKLLEAEGIVVDIIPATVPPAYWADAFISIHSDGNTNSSVSGYKIAAPRRDLSNKSNELVKLIEEKYGEETGLEKDPNITRNMTGYYAFSWRRFQHAIHPMTPAVIVETGFLTNPSDAKLITNTPEIPAKAIADAVLIFLKK